jgi:hypothetical protein
VGILIKVELEHIIDNVFNFVTVTPLVEQRITTTCPKALYCYIIKAAM